MEELALGQRLGKDILNSAWTDEEVKLVEGAGLTMDEVIAHWVTNHGEDTLNAAIGGVLTMKEHGDVERSAPIQSQEEADAAVHADVISHDMSGTPENVADLISPPSTNE